MARTSRNDWIYATDAQKVFLRRLYHEAFEHFFPVVMPSPVSVPERMLKREASAEIDRLLRAKASGWR